MYQQKSSVSASLYFLAMSIVLTSFLTACSGSGGGAPQNQGNSVDPSTLPPGTGGITFQVSWQPPLSSSNSQRLMAAAFNSCVDYGIGTISATVSSGTTTITSTSWPCSLHQGTVIGVPAGSNYTLKVGGISSGTTLWSGQATSLTVNAGAITNAGIITMNYGGADTTKPTVGQVGANSNPANTTSVPVTDRINIVFSEPVMNSTVTTTNITLTNTTTSKAIAGTVSYDIPSKTASFIPTSNLDYSNQYVLQVATGIRDLANNTLSSSSTFNFTTESAPTVPANAPTGLTAKAGNGQIKLDWLAVNGATSYNIYYGLASGVTISGTPLTVARPPALHVGLTNNTTYYYIVTAVTNTNTVYGESLASAETSTTPNVPAGNPAAPTSLAVNYNGGVSPYTVTWPTVSGLSYNLYWSTRPIYPDHNAADNLIRYIAGGTYTHSSVTPGLTYCYILTAMNTAGESADSNQVCGPGAGSILVTWP